jgi:2-C-methyl-D-erythritol 4-phosphate cytidylyltransferase
LVLAAGSGTRLGQSKALLDCDGRTLLEFAVERVAAFSAEVLVGLTREDMERAPGFVGSRATALVIGGATRHATVGVLLAQATRRLVLLHEVARPLAPPMLFTAVLEAAQTHGAAAACVRLGVSDTVAVEENGFLEAALPREKLVKLQTPQAFRRDWLVDAFRRSHDETKHASSVPPLLLDAGYHVRLVPGTAENIKITFPEDWERVRVKLAALSAR